MNDLLRIVALSDKRRKLLMYLADGPKSWEGIKDTLQVTSTGILPQIKILEDEHLVIRDGKEFTLTETGRLIVQFLKPFDEALGVVSQERKFWAEHHIHALPDEFLLRLGELGRTKIIECSVEDSFEPHVQFLQSLQQARQIKGISPIVHPLYPNLFLNLTKDHRDVSLILTKSAFEKIRKDYYDMLMEGLRMPNANLFIYDGDIRFAYIVTDSVFSISFFLMNGLFDSKQDLISLDRSARKFGDDLFTYYQHRSHQIVPP